MKKDTSLRDLILGTICFAGGVYLIFQNTRVSSFWGFYFGRTYVSSGLLIIPMLLGIIWKVLYPKSFGPWILIGLDILVILLHVIMNVRIWWLSTSLFDFILMFGLTAVGIGLLIRALFLSDAVRHK